MTDNRLPSLSDLVILWLQETIGLGHRIEYGGGPDWRSYYDMSDHSLKVDGYLIGYVYDDTLDMLTAGVYTGSEPYLKAGDPLFFDKLWKRLEDIAMTQDCLYETPVTSYLAEKK